MSEAPSWGVVIRDVQNTLLFRREALSITYSGRHLAFGCLATLVAGAGRHWDNPRAEVFQNLGFVSLSVIIGLSLVLWLMTWPLGPDNWSFRRVLTFCSLTAPLAWLYAVPVERWMPLSSAQAINVWFLAVVALWRVALWWRFLDVSARLSSGVRLVACLLPLALVVTLLTLLNLDHVVFNIMAGNDVSKATPHDGAFSVLFVITMFSVVAFPVLLIAWMVLIVRRRRQTKGSHDS